MIHLTRALLAAAITCTIGPFIVLIWALTIDAAETHGMSAGMIIGAFVETSPLFVLSFIALVVLISLPMALLWCIPRIRHSFRRPWVASIAGAIAGVLLSIPWSMVISLISGDQWDFYYSYRKDIGLYLIASATSGALYAFLHAFFIRQALAKREWLAIQPPSPEHR